MFLFLPPHQSLLPSCPALLSSRLPPSASPYTGHMGRVGLTPCLARPDTVRVMPDWPSPLCQGQSKHGASLCAVSCLDRTNSIVPQANPAITTHLVTSTLLSQSSVFALKTRGVQSVYNRFCLTVSSNIAQFVQFLLVQLYRWSLKLTEPTRFHFRFFLV